MTPFWLIVIVGTLFAFSEEIFSALRDVSLAAWRWCERRIAKREGRAPRDFPPRP